MLITKIKPLQIFSARAAGPSTDHANPRAPPTIAAVMVLQLIMNSVTGMKIFKSRFWTYPKATDVRQESFKRLNCHSRNKPEIGMKYSGEMIEERTRRSNLLFLQANLVEKPSTQPLPRMRPLRPPP